MMSLQLIFLCHTSSDLLFSHNYSWISWLSNFEALTFASISLVNKAGTKQEKNTSRGFHLHSSAGEKKNSGLYIKTNKTAYPPP